jgi:cobalt-zinc-cadmium efflux system membrane fusion protein
MKPHIIFAILALLSQAACKRNTLPPTEVATVPFSLTDTMLQSTRYEPARMDVLRNELRLFGKIAADNNKLIEIFPVVGGSVLRVYVELGDYVKKGALLATIRSTEVAGFEKDLQDAENELLVARNNLRVTQELYEGKLAAEHQLVEARSNVEKAVAQLNRVKEVFQIYNLKGGSVYEVRAPISGFVTEKNINQDMQLRSDRTDNIFDIAQIDEVWVLANVNESDIASVRLGIDAEVVTLSYPGKVFRGKVDKIYNIIDPETQAMRVRVKMDNPGFLLKPEMRASVSLRFEEHERMLSIPAAALVFDKNKTFAMVFKDRNTIETRQVGVFREIGERAYISSGLSEGDQVITQNQLLVYDALND